MKKRKFREFKSEIKEQDYEPQEVDIYTDDGVFLYCEDDAISAAEEGFMIGYLAAQVIKMLGKKKNFVEWKDYMQQIEEIDNFYFKKEVKDDNIKIKDYISTDLS